MITQITGKLVEKTPTYVVLDCNGIGYRINISLQTFDLGLDQDIYGIQVIDDFITIRTTHDMKILQIKKKETPIEELCNVCYGTIKQRYVIIPCGHSRTCYRCLVNLQSCPMCRCLMESYMKIYS